MRRKNAGHIIRIVIGSLIAVIGVLALAVLVLALYAGITKTNISVGLGDFDVGVTPVDYQLIERKLRLGQPYISRSTNPVGTQVCYVGNIHQASLWAVRLYVETCDLWSYQSLPGAVPTAPVQAYPSSVYTSVPTIGTP